VAYLGPLATLTSHLESGLSSLGVPGVPWHPQISSDQLTLSQPRGADYAHQKNTGTLGFSDLPTALRMIDPPDTRTSPPTGRGPNLLTSKFTHIQIYYIKKENKSTLPQIEIFISYSPQGRHG
jgi:hypothetical protein